MTEQIDWRTAYDDAKQAYLEGRRSIEQLRQRLAESQAANAALRATLAQLEAEGHCCFGMHIGTGKHDEDCAIKKAKEEISVNVTGQRCPHCGEKIW